MTRLDQVMTASAKTLLIEKVVSKVMRYNVISIINITEAEQGCRGKSIAQRH